jgi:hypothetical protein
MKEGVAGLTPAHLTHLRHHHVLELTESGRGATKRLV